MLVPLAQIGDEFVVASQHPISSSTLEKLQFALNRRVGNVVVPSDLLASLLKRYEDQSAGEF